MQFQQYKLDCSRLTPFHVWEVHRWARSKAEEHAARADALRRIIDASALKHEGVDALEAHHWRIAARYKAVARAMQD